MPKQNPDLERIINLIRQGIEDGTWQPLAQARVAVGELGENPKAVEADGLVAKGMKSGRRADLERAIELLEEGAALAESRKQPGEEKAPVRRAPKSRPKRKRKKKGPRS